MSKRKIINDPIYGLVHFPFDLLYELIDHKYFQRLRRISQMGLSNYVYPGATHSRFSHALGALYLMTSAIGNLRNKSVEISDDEYLATCVAILLHDVGHGPFSHALERLIIEKDHESISLDIMRQLRPMNESIVDLAIDIFTGKYHKKFLTQLVSSQLDMDRMDYLTRDSYYSGVAEGVIGYKRIIAMLNVVDDQLVVEEKGLYSIEKFIVARHIMYWQVYLHKASLAIEQMLRFYVSRLKQLLQSGTVQQNGSDLHTLLSSKHIPDDYLDAFICLDDIDIFYELKNAHSYEDRILKFVGQSILERKLFAVRLTEEKPSTALEAELSKTVADAYGIELDMAKDLIITGEESNKAYDIVNDQIRILRKNGDVTPVSQMMDIKLKTQTITKHFIIYPK